MDRTPQKDPLLSRREPIVNAPAAVLWLVLAFVVVHVGRSLLSEIQDAYVVLGLGFIPARYGPDLYALPGGMVAAVTSFVTHIFLHGDVVHLAINSAWLLALGSPVVRRLGAVRFMLYFLFCGAAGALAFLLINPGLAAPMVGASGAISGLMGGLLRFMFPAIDDGNGPALQNGAPGVQRSSLGAALSDRRILLTIGIWVILNFVFAAGFSDYGAIAWEAHLGGFIAGFLAFGLFDRVATHTPDVAPPDV